MSVYVDRAELAYGRMLMSHMLADTSEELLAMAERIGLAARWIQHRGRPDEHFDVSKGYRRRALKAGAIEVSSRELVAIIRRRRGKSPSSRVASDGGVS